MIETKQRKVYSLIQTGYGYHQHGKLTDAQRYYALALELDGANFDALRLTGLLFAQVNRFDQAEIYLAKALQINPNQAACHSNYGNALKEMGRFDDALHSYEKALALDVANAEAYSNKGVVLQHLGHLDEAFSCFQRAISIKPNYIDALFNCGNVLAQLQRFIDSLDFYDRTIKANPSHLKAFINRAMILKKLDRLEEALFSFDKAICIKPDYPEIYSDRGNILTDLKRYQEALDSYEKAILLRPDYAGAYSNRGNVLQKLRRHQEALDSYEKAISIQPDFVQAFSNRGATLQSLKRVDEAISSFDQAIKLNPDYPEAYCNKGNSLLYIHRPKEAINCYEKAIELKPDYVEAYSNKANVLKDCIRLDEAVVEYKKAISIDPNFMEAHGNLALCNLVSGNFQEGWLGCEVRWKHNMKEVARSFTQPLWLGSEPLLGKTILIYAEQGLGDTLQFYRYLPLVIKMGAKVIFEAPIPLVRLLRDVEGIGQIFTAGDELPPFDYQCPLMSLPLAFKTDLNSIPAVCAPNISDVNVLSQWRTKLGEKRGLRVGLAWSGNQIHNNDHNRSLTLVELLPYLPSGVEYFCLQKEVRVIDKELLDSHGEIRYFCKDLNNFYDTAALCELMDIVISVDTSVAHLAATLGRPTWILIPFSPDWRWLLNRGDSPWYSSVKLYRQEVMGDWIGVLQRVGLDIRAEECSHKTKVC